MFLPLILNIKHYIIIWKDFEESGQKAHHVCIDKD
jgi:hypothetical protein